jgi:poly(hydroxyalkanoate) depolymerase family esterase
MQHAWRTAVPTEAGLLLHRKATVVAPEEMTAAANDGTEDAAAATHSELASWPYASSVLPVVAPTLVEEETERAAPGEFVEGSITNDSGTRTYKLYIPASYQGQPMPLVVMLHGCKQDPDDFAAGTRMNIMAEENQCLVLYPAQSKTANSPKCWSWFNAADQERERGEPSMIADMTRRIMDAYSIDKSMVYVAGLSAGGAMAVIMANTYPDIFAAAAIHSGMPYNAARSLFSALSAMKHGPRSRWHDGLGLHQQTEETAPAVPMIVFHGDADRVVHPMNGEHVIKQAVAAGTESDPVAVTTVVEQADPEMRSYTRTIFHDEGGRNMAEQWVIHGSGHAWSGGSSDGSFTDPNGPDATGEMMRFFYQHRLPAG